MPVPRQRHIVLQEGQEQYYSQQPGEYEYTQQQEDPYGYTHEGMQQDHYGSTQKDEPMGPVEWYFMDNDNQQNGPVTAEQMSRLYDDGRVGPDTYIWSPQKQPEWLTLGESGIRYKHGCYDPRSTTQTYEQWLAATGSPRGWIQ